VLPCWPGNDEFVLRLVLLRAGNEFLEFRVNAYHASQEGALVEFLKHGRHEELLHGLAQFVVIRRGDEIEHELMVIHEEIVQFAVTLFFKLIAFHGAENGAEGSRMLRDLGNGPWRSSHSQCKASD
jgi:hypothetical protein